LVKRAALGVHNPIFGTILNTKAYTSMEQRPYASHHMYLETTIEQPVARVWPHALDIQSWMTAHRLETISGRSGTVGHLERVHPRDLGSDVALPHYHLYGLGNVVPYKFIALEVFPEKGGSYGDDRQWMSFDGIVFVDLGASTKVIFLMVDVQLEGTQEADRRRREKELSEGRKLIEGYFENLRKLSAS
jgi:hypothetical protein